MADTVAESSNGILHKSPSNGDDRDNTKVAEHDENVSELRTPKGTRSKDKKVKKEKSDSKPTEEPVQNGNHVVVDGKGTLEENNNKTEQKKKKRKQDESTQKDSPNDAKDSKEKTTSNEPVKNSPRSAKKSSSTTDAPKETISPENDEKDGEVTEHGLKGERKLKKQGSTYSKNSDRESLKEEKSEEKKKEDKTEVDSGNEKKSKQSKSEEDQEKHSKSNSDNEKSPSKSRKKRSFLIESIDKRRKKDSINSASESDLEDVVEMELVRNPELKELLLSERQRAKTKSRLFVHKTNEIGQIIYKGHPSWELMGDIQTAIRHVIGKSSKLLPSEDLEKTKDINKSADFFKQTIFLRFPRAGSAETPSHNFHNFKFKDYSPLAFRHLRQKFNIDPADYMVSLCNTLPDGTNALRELPTPGKSGSLFLFSQDQRYILKTIPKREAKLLRGLLPAYYYHVMENPDTLLPKFFGLHRIKPTGGRQVRFVVMENVFRTQKEIHERYDLKGSIFGRAASEEEKKKMKNNVTYKDVDWRAREKRLHIGPEKKVIFLEQLKKDCTLLEKLNIMDYSMLVGIHYCNSNDGADCITECVNIPARKELERRKKERKEKRKEKKKTEVSDEKSDKKKADEKSDKKKTEFSDEKKKIDEKSGKEEIKAESSKKKSKEVESTESVAETPGTFSTIITKVTETMRKARSNDDNSEAESSNSKLPPTLRHKSITMTTYPLPDHYQGAAVSCFQQEDGGMIGISNKGEILHEFYYIGIIDILMLWTMRKKAEHAYKSLRAKPDEISSVSPKEYSARFQKFVTDHMID